jgi:acetyltransferase-like isoleucine patch superfamily enzyme
MGVNSTLADNVKIGSDSLVGAGALITKSIVSNSFVKGQVGEASSRTAKEYFKITD